MRTQLIGIVAVLATGATAGAIFGERTVPESDTELVMRASQIVRTMITWLPTEHDPADIVYDGIDGMLEVLDPHSNYLDPRSFRDMRMRQEGSFFGVGIIISMRDGRVTVIAPMEGTPAAQKGLRAGDVIGAVEGVSTEELPLDEVVERIRGPEGSSVRMTIRRPGLEEPFDVEITRTRIPQTTVRFAFMLQPGVGYIRLTEFSNTSVLEVQQALQRLGQQGMQRLVLDLRNNPGGSLDAAIGVSDTFLHKGQLIVSTRGRTADNNSRIEAPGRGERFEGPLVVLVNEGSASASEIVAGAVQDHDRGLVVGDVTWGKGLVQTVFTVRDTGLALTTARYYTPSGRCIQRGYESYIDYMTHRNGAPAAGDIAQAFETDVGRTVLGGGGITPDIEVPGRTVPEAVVRFYGEAAFFRFAVELLKDVPASEAAELARSFSVDDGVMTSFWSWAVEQKVVEEDAVVALRADPQVTSEVERGIRSEVMNSAVGLEAGYRVVSEADNQLQAALDNLEVAEDMWKVWLANGKGS